MGIISWHPGCWSAAFVSICTSICNDMGVFLCHSICWKVLFVSIFARMCNDMGFVLCHPGCRNAGFVSIFTSICNSMGVILRPSLSHLNVPDTACRQTTALHRCFALLFAHILPIHETLEGQDLFCRPWINSCSTSPDSPEPVRK